MKTIHFIHQHDRLFISLFACKNVKHEGVMSGPENSSHKHYQSTIKTYTVRTSRQRLCKLIKASNQAIHTFLMNYKITSGFAPSL